MAELIGKRSAVQQRGMTGMTGMRSTQVSPANPKRCISPNNPATRGHSPVKKVQLKKKGALPFQNSPLPYKLPLIAKSSAKFVPILPFKGWYGNIYFGLPNWSFHFLLVSPIGQSNWPFQAKLVIPIGLTTPL